MTDWVDEESKKIRKFFLISDDQELYTSGPGGDLSETVKSQLGQFNIEWHIIPGEQSVPMDDAYFKKLYPRSSREFTKQREKGLSYRERLAKGHAQHQGKIVGVETTQKPKYLPGNRQFYGTLYGHDPSADPLTPYMGRAGMMNGTRYDHNYLSLRTLLRVLSDDWRSRSMLPAGYRLTICPPAVFNLIGTIFNPQWGESETLELGFYRDDEGNAQCYAVGSNGPGDFSYINEVEGEGEWSQMGFRLALVPE